MTQRAQIGKDVSLLAVTCDSFLQMWCHFLENRAKTKYPGKFLILSQLQKAPPFQLEIYLLSSMLLHNALSVAYIFGNLH